MRRMKEGEGRGEAEGNGPAPNEAERSTTRSRRRGCMNMRLRIQEKRILRKFLMARTTREEAMANKGGRRKKRGKDDVKT